MKRNKKKEIDEDIVFAGADDVIQKLTEFNETKKRRCSESLTTNLKPVWTDGDDGDFQVKSDSRFKSLRHLAGKSLSSTQYQQALTNQYEKAMGMQPEWAQLDRKGKASDDDDESEEELQKSTGSWLKSSQTLPPSIIDFNKCPDLNKDRAVKGKAHCVEFHPSARIALVAGADSAVSLFQVNGKDNPKIQSVFIDRFPVHSAHFTREGNEIIIGSRTKCLYSYDLLEGKVTLTAIRGQLEKHQGDTRRLVLSPDGRYIALLSTHGKIHILSLQSKEWVDTLNMNGEVEAATFNSDGSRLLSFGGDSDVYVWDMKTRSCVHRFNDHGCVTGSAIAVSPQDRYVAAGSPSGVVNIYDYENAMECRRPNPLKSVMNLTTACTSLKFNSTSEILGMASNESESSVKLLHVPTLSVFSNFPAFGEKMRIPLSMDFSLHTGYFSVANCRGKALLYRLKHYNDY